MQSTTAGTTTFGFLAGTAIMAVLMPEISVPFLLASAVVGGGSGAAVGFGVGAVDDFASNYPTAAAGIGLLALAALAGGIYVAAKYA
jgi:hypothetical protein